MIPRVSVVPFKRGRSRSEKEEVPVVKAKPKRARSRSEKEEVPVPQAKARPKRKAKSLEPETPYMRTSSSRSLAGFRKRSASSIATST